ncbi:hypothetical protein [Aneurinibacillus aneurinilyticus]|uniref:hypothetical protein n=1 Tax=Aneurinibacillus aneurinilyticus TaxID=1391 RepID=UPI003524E378
MKVIWNNDGDGIFSACFLEQFKGWKPFAYYDFNKMVTDTTYIIDGKYVVKNSEVVYVDVAVEGKRRTIDMHITKISQDDKTNPNSLNPNHYISKVNYTQKCAWAAAIAILSYIDFDFSTLTDEQKMIIWGLDSSYLSYFFDKNIFNKWVEFFGVQELATVFNTYEKSDFEQVQYTYGLQGMIHINQDGYLYTVGCRKRGKWCPAINFEAIQKHFPYVRLPQNKHVIEDIGLQPMKFETTYLKSKHDIDGRVFSFALNGKNHGQYSIR